MKIKQTAVSYRTNGEEYIGITDTSAARQIKFSREDHRLGYIVIIADESGACSTNNITMIDEDGALIDGQPSYIYTVDYSALSFYWTGTFWKVK